MSDSSAPPVRNWKHIGLIAAGVLGLCAFVFWLWLPAKWLRIGRAFQRHDGNEPQRLQSIVHAPIP